MSKSEYTLVLPAFTIGIHAYDAIGKITKHFGKKSSSSAVRRLCPRLNSRSSMPLPKRISKSSTCCGMATMPPLNTSIAC